MPRSAIRASSTSRRSSRWLLPMIPSIPGASTSHRRDRPAVVVHPHVKGFDGLRVVHHDDRLLRVFFGQIALVLRLPVDAPLDRELELLLGPLEYLDRLAVFHMHEFRADDPSSFATSPFSIRSSKKARSSCLSFSNAARVYFSNSSASAALSERSAKAISGSIIQNSARWRLVFEFSARKVGPTA
jgi:hypothetical protein